MSVMWKYQLSTLKYSEILILVRYSYFFVISSQHFFQLLSTLLTSLTSLNLLTSSHYSKHFSHLLSSPLLTVSQIFVPLLSASQLVTSLNTPHPVTTFWTFLNALLNALLYSSHLCSLLVPWSTLLASSKFVSPLQPSSSRLVSPLLNATNSIWGWADFTSFVTRSFSWKLLCTQPQRHGTLMHLFQCTCYHPVG